ncbi:MAG: PadR family transcriptional regulator [Longimicrobiales bacterium]
MGHRHDPFGFADWGVWCGFGPGPGFGPFGRHGRRGRRHGPRARVFDRGDLKYAILGLLRDKPMHGYEIMQALEDESGGWYSPSAGTVYPALQLLQDQGYVESEEIEGKRVYRIMASGREFLDRHSDRVEDVLGRVSAFAEQFSAGDVGELTSTFVRFAQASWEEAFRGMGDERRMSELKAIIERAMREMRRTSRNDERGEASNA